MIQEQCKCIELEVELADVEPRVWRRLVVPDTLPLFGLHLTIQGAMAWRNAHLHSFEIAGKEYGDPEMDFGGDGDTILDEREFALRDLLKTRGTAYYTYDFGDDWLHIVRQTKKHRKSGPFFLPYCDGGERSGPPEDCGGPPGYEAFLQAYGDPCHPEHPNVREWGGVFEPEVFSVHQANALILAYLLIGMPEELFPDIDDLLSQASLG